MTRGTPLPCTCGHMQGCHIRRARVETITRCLVNGCPCQRYVAPPGAGPKTRTEYVERIQGSGYFVKVRVPIDEGEHAAP